MATRKEYDGYDAATGITSNDLIKYKDGTSGKVYKITEANLSAQVQDDFMASDYKSTDGTLADNSDTVLPTEKAVKTYVDNRHDENTFETYFKNETAFTRPMSDAIEILGAEYVGQDYVIVQGQDLTSLISADDIVWLYDIGVAENEAGVVASVQLIDSDTKITFSDNLAYGDDNHYYLRYQTGDVIVGNVAIGDYSIASGELSFASGARSIASGIRSIAGMSGSVASGYCSVSFGADATASGDYSMATGSDASASGDFSLAVGAASFASGDFSIALGAYSEARERAQIALASGRISTNNGDAQSTQMVSYKQTTNSTPSELIYTTANRYSIKEGGIFAVDLTVIGSNSDASVLGKYKRTLVIKNISGTTSLSGSVETIGTDIEIGGIGGISVTADDVNDCLSIIVTGKDATTINWVVSINATEVGFY